MPGRRVRNSRRVRRSRKSTRSKRSSKSRRRVSRKMRGGESLWSKLKAWNARRRVILTSNKNDPAKDYNMVEYIKAKELLNQKRKEQETKYYNEYHGPTQ
jgi:hypothetical protein